MKVGFPKIIPYLNPLEIFITKRHVNGNMMLVNPDLILNRCFMYTLFVDTSMKRCPRSELREQSLFMFYVLPLPEELDCERRNEVFEKKLNERSAKLCYGRKRFKEQIIYKANKRF